MTKLDDLKKEKIKIEQEIIAEQDRNFPTQASVAQDADNKYLIIGFWEFAILSTLMIVFFPWSLLFCVIFYGLHETKLIVFALLHDFLKTIFAILSILLPIIGLILFLIVSAN